jgi:hypothetical protein
MYAAKHGVTNGGMEDRNQTEDQGDCTLRDETEDERCEAAAETKEDCVAESIYPGVLPHYTAGIYLIRSSYTH